MSTDTLAHPQGPTEPPSVRILSPGARRRRLKSRVMSWVLFVALLGALIPLAIILWQTLQNGLAAMGWNFLVEIEPLSYREEGGGYAHGIFGTLYMTALAALMAIPLGVLAALYLVEFGSGLFANVVRFFTDVMTGVPSIFVGLAVYTILVTQMRFGTLVGAVSLAIIMLPIVVRSSEEMLNLVPPDLRSASAGLGARRWQTSLKVVLPAAGPGIMTGCMLAIARGAGETAPLVLTALGAREIVTGLQTGTGQADVGLLMIDGLSQPFQPGIDRAWAGGLTLIVVVLVFNVLARTIAQRRRV
jgi:phosphate transport system permease protein